MTKKDIKSKQGFTIIEVVLVLAIAGLIFLMVFIALPNLQRSQRDSQRRQDYAALSSAMTTYITNNNGSLPTTLTAAQDAPKYINADGKDPNGFTYALSLKACTTNGCGITANNMKASKTDATTVYVVTKAYCDNGALKYVNNTRSYAIYGALETGATYCQSNS